MIVWKKSFLVQITVLLMILSLFSPATTSFARGYFTTADNTTIYFPILLLPSYFHFFKKTHFFIYFIWKSL
ncbi:hypothetical protein WQ54_15195 [Bacillus sp. SA1-12]|nr:hypothetical protein WQ54_15195 [Bacillus sp. SA1-12]